MLNGKQEPFAPFNKMRRERISLCGEWRLAWSETHAEGVCSQKTGEAGGLKFARATVPGCFELDLQALGEVGDPFYGMNPVEVNAFAEKQHVYYTRMFSAPSAAGAAPYLVFEGLDCCADVFVNGTLVASPDNMLTEHTVCVKDCVTEGENEVFVHIRPARQAALGYEYPQLLSSLLVNYESLYIRKAPHMYGWDIMPRFISAGMYRPVYIEYKPASSFDEVYLKTVAVSDDRSEAHLILSYKLDGALYTAYTLRVEMECGDSRFATDCKPPFLAGRVNIRLTDPKLWWPKNRGEANLYDVKLTLLADGVPADVCVFRHGVRTVELLRTALTNSTQDGEFVFKVNGEKVFCKGSNWVPVDAFHSRDRERIPKILEMVNDLNCNMLRCWGGNVYEDETFYDICDASGIMVWQDFAMACSIYPQDSDFQARIKQEAEAVVKRLRGRASIVLWSGDNECDQSYYWGRSKVDPNTNVLTRVVLPEAVRLHDGTRPYIGSSPFVDKEAVGHHERYLSEMHLWGPRDYFKSKFYITSLCHFVSEIGYHGCPGRASVEKFISPEKVWPCFNDEWTLHSTSPLPGFITYDYRVELMNKQIAELFTAIPDNLDDFAFASQVVQAEAKKFFIEMFRIAKWKRTGILWWNIMDGWPQFSDAIVDYYFARKLAYPFIKNAQADVCAMLDEPESWNQRVVISNDTRFDRRISLRVTDVESGETVFERDCVAYADKATAVGSIPYKRNRQRLFLLEWSGEAEGRNHYLAGQPPFALETYKGLLKASGLYDAYLM